MKRIRLASGMGLLIFLLILSVVVSVASLIAVIGGSVTSTVLAETSIGVVGEFLCPEGSKPELKTYQTSTYDGYTHHPATAYEMQCVAGDGTVVREASPDYAFYWIGLLWAAAMAASFVISIIITVAIVFLLNRSFAKPPRLQP